MPHMLYPASICTEVRAAYIYWWPLPAHYYKPPVVHIIWAESTRPALSCNVQAQSSMVWPKICDACDHCQAIRDITKATFSPISTNLLLRLQVAQLPRSQDLGIFVVHSCLAILCKLDHVLSSCIVDVVKVVNIVGSRYTSRINASASWLSTLIVKSFNHREGLNRAVQLPNFRSVRWHTAHSACYI